MAKENDNKKTFWRKSSLWIILSAVVVFYNIGHNVATIDLEEEKADYDKIVSAIDKNNDELDSVTNKLDDKQKDLDDKGDEVDKALTAIENKDDTEDEISSLEDDLSGKETELRDLKGNIEDEEKELEKIETNIIKKEEEPIELLSGEWIVGSDADVPEGRYQANGSANFVVRSDIESLEVNTLLDDSGRGDYVFFANDGDVIEASSQTTLTPVE